jgi:hypothetical protein
MSTLPHDQGTINPTLKEIETLAESHKWHLLDHLSHLTSTETPPEQITHGAMLAIHQARTLHTLIAAYIAKHPSG